MRFFLRLIFYTLFAKWLYAEAVLLVPVSEPVLKRLSHAVQIPTHDKWSDDSKIMLKRQARILSRRIRDEVVSAHETTSLFSTFHEYTNLSSSSAQSKLPINSY